MKNNRRSFLKKLTAGGAASLMGGGIFPDIAGAAPEKSRVAFAAGTDRRDLMAEVLKPFRREIERGIRGKRILIKPNNVWHGNPLCATHPDAIRGMLDFLKPLTDMPIEVGESTASPEGTGYTFEEYGYTPLEREYNVSLVDLNTRPSKTEWIFGADGCPLNIEIIDSFLDPDTYIISLARMKTHNCVVATLAMKNVVMASPLNVHKDHPSFVSNQYEKAKMHQGGIPGINYNMFLIANRVRPHFSVIDGFEGMEGNGPNNGTPVEHGVALAGLDVVAVDRIGIELMGIDYADVGYLQWCSNAGYGQGDITKIDVQGPAIRDHVISYRLHDNIEWQMGWKKTEG